MSRTNRRLTLLLGLLATTAMAGCSCGEGPQGTTPAKDAGANPDPATVSIVGVVVGPDEKPVAGAKVALGLHEAETDGVGRFFLGVAADAGRALRITAEGFAKAERAVDPSSSAWLSAGTVVLAKLSASGEVDGAGGTVGDVASGVKVEVPAGAFSRKVRIEAALVALDDPLVADAKLPAPLPQPANAIAAPIFGLVLEAEGEQPAQPLAVAIVSSAGLPAGTQVPVGRFDLETGEWVDAAVATAQADGSLAFAVDHLSTFAASLPSLPKDPTEAPDLDALSRVPSPFLPGEPRVDPRSGALQIGVELPALVRRGARIGLTLFHDSRTPTGQLDVATAIPDGKPGEDLLATVRSPLGDRRTALEVGATIKEGQPAVLVNQLAAKETAHPLATESQPVEGAGPGRDVTGKPMRVETTVARPVPGVLHEAKDLSFTKPTRGEALKNGAGEEVPTPSPIPVGETKTQVVAIDNRAESPFGPGWHLQGLTRLVQPWCSQGEVAMVGGFDKPATVYGRLGNLYVEPVSAALAKAGADLSGSPLVAWSGQKLYVGTRLSTGGLVWRMDESGAVAQVAGGGTAGPPRCDIDDPGDLYLRELLTLEAHTSGDGVLLANEECIFHLRNDGSLSKVMGGGAEKVRTGVAAEEVTFLQELQGFAAAPNGDWYIDTYNYGRYLVRDGVFQSLRTRSSHPHGLVVAFDRDGAFFYTAPESPCLYRHDDGIYDSEVFPSCLQGYPEGLADGPASSATAGEIVALSFDDMGNLWFVDSTFRALRRLGADGLVITVAGNRGTGAASLGGPASEANLGVPWSLDAVSSEQVAVGADGHVFKLKPVLDTELQGLAAGDGSLLSKQSNGSWLRVLADGVRESYDERGLIVSRGRPGEPPLRYLWDHWKRSKQEEACGAPQRPPRLTSIALGDETLFSFEWDGDRVTAIADAAGRRTTLAWEGGRIGRIRPAGADEVLFNYDGEARIVVKTSRGPAGSLSRWEYAYKDGRVESVRVPGRGERTYESAEGSVAVPASKVSAAGVARQVVAKPAVAAIPTRTGGAASLELGVKEIEVKNPTGDTTRLRTDELGRIVRTTRPDGTELEMTRDEAGRVVALRNVQSGETWRYKFDRQTGLLTERTSPANHTTRYQHDASGRVISRTDPNGASTRFDFGGSGAAEGMPTKVVDAADLETLIDYDRFGNPVRYTAPGGLVTQIERDRAGRVVKVTEPSGLEYRTEYDARDGVTRQAWGDPEQGREIVYKRVVTDGWEGAGSHVPASALAEVTDGEGRVWRYVRDAAFNLTRIEAPAEGPVGQSFDSQGRRTRQSFADGSSEELVWDDAGRLFQRIFSGAARGARLELEYDELGRVKRLTDPLLTESRSFDPGIGWRQVAITPHEALGEASRFVLSRSRSAAGTVRHEIGATAFTQHRDFDGKVSRVVRSTPGVGDERDVLVATFDAARRLETLARGNGVTTRRVYDEHGRVARQEEQTPGGTVVFEWTYDAAGRPATRTVFGVTRTYGYDAFNQLASCSDTLQSWTYDKAGARASAGGVAWSRDAGGRLVDDGQFTYAWDTLGRRVRRTSKADPSQVTEYVWGAGGRLTSVRQGGETVASYDYDGSGRRVRRTIAAGSWRYGYLPDSDRPVRVVEPDGTEWHLVHAWASAPYTLAVSGSRARYVHVDPFERVIGVSDETGALTVLQEDCLGLRYSAAEPGGPPIGFHGMAWDAETGLYQAGPRFYDPIVGEFLSPDPGGIETGADPFGYGGGNPVLRADPSGRLFFVAVGAVLAGAVIANKIRQFAQSAEVKRARSSYDAITEEGDDALENAEKAHKRLHKAADKGGDVAIECTKTGIEAITNPTRSADDLKDKLKELAEDALKEALNDEGSDDESGDEGGSAEGTES